MGSDDMSVEAKERAFRKARQLSGAEQEWLTVFIALGQRLPKNRLRIEEYRGVLLHLKLSRDQLMTIMSGICTIAVERAELVLLFQDALRKSGVFRDNVLTQKVRELAQAHGLTTKEILAARVF